MLYLVQSCVLSQKGDDKWLLTLQHVRTATLSDDDVTFLSSLQLSESDPRLPADATRIFYTNAEVDAYNDEKLSNISGEIFVSKSVISSPVGCRPKILNGRVDDTAFAESVCLKVGCRVMLVYNVDVKDGLTNGQLGVIAGINTSDASQIDCVFVNFDNENVGESLRKQYSQFHRMYPGAVPISSVLSHTS